MFPNGEKSMSRRILTKWMIFLSVAWALTACLSAHPALSYHCSSTFASGIVYKKKPNKAEGSPGLKTVLPSGSMLQGSIVLLELSLFCFKDGAVL